jgi:hypothetical protein
MDAIATTSATPLHTLDHEIDVARRVLRELWWKATAADRIFAVDRLLREDMLAPAVQAKLQHLQDVVRDAWVTARVASALHESVPADAQLAGLQLTIAERDRDNYLEAHRLYDALFIAAESYLRSVPIVAGGSFRELVHERDRLRAKLVPILPPLDAER